MECVSRKIANLLPSSGLSISPEEFLQTARNYPNDLHPREGTDIEGYISGRELYRCSGDLRSKLFEGFTDTFTQKLTRRSQKAFSGKD
jgi:hypothetical protein